jgi:adenylate cyclase
LRLTPGRRSPPSAPKTSNSEAYDSYLRGRYLLNKRTAEGFHKALSDFQQAIAAAPNYVVAYSALAETHILMATYRPLLKPPSCKPAPQQQQALAIDATFTEPHAILALIAQNHDWNWPEAEREYKLALASDANNATAHNRYAAGLAVRRRFEDGFREVASARKLDPLSLVVRGNEAEMFYLARQYDAALNRVNRALEMEPNFSGGHLIRGLIYEKKGLWREALDDLETARKLDDTPRTVGMLGQAYALATGPHARAIVSELQDRAKHEYLSPLYSALVFAGLGERDTAFSDLEKAHAERTMDLLGLKVSPAL